jgi:hypothetical protein
MKTQTKIAIAAILLATRIATHAQRVNDYSVVNCNRFTSLLPAPTSTIRLRDLSYPSPQPVYVSPRSDSFGLAVTMPRFDVGSSSYHTSLSTFDSGLRTLPRLGGPCQSPGSSLFE